VPASLAPGARLVVGPLDWTHQFEGESLLVSVSAEGDRSNLESVTVGPILNSQLVPLDNNIAQRAM
jgi:hypothetical protein